MSCRSEWFTTEQRAGDLVKIQKCIRPRLSRHDDQFTRTEKNRILRAMKNKDTPLSRHPSDRCELMLALMGRKTTHYVLTYDEEHLPPSWGALKRDFKLFTRKLRRAKGRAVDWVACPEAKHGDARYHIHVVLMDRDFRIEDVRKLWGKGFVLYGPTHKYGGDRYRFLANYFTKENRDGVKLPIGSRQWSCSRSLSAKLPKPERYISDSGHISIPKNASICSSSIVRNSFGFYNYVSYVLPARV